VEIRLLNVFFWERKTEFGIQDTDEKCAGCRILMKMKWGCGIRTPVPSSRL